MKASSLTVFLVVITSLVSVMDFAGAEELRIAFIAGRQSHGYGSHEHYAGCKVIGEAIKTAIPDSEIIITSNGWPEDDAHLDDVDAIVIYSDGGKGHPAASHLDRLADLAAAGKGIVCLHYAVEVDKETAGDKFKPILGGYFETHYSVNPVWEADFTQLPDHPIARGIDPFSAYDEWYFHMRFLEEMDGITPILSAVAPESTMNRPDGPHSGNPYVRKSVADGEPQHVAWAFERPDGGRSFGFTGGHYHWNWGNRQIIQLVRNAVLWTAKSELPSATASPPSATQLADGQDEERPNDLDITQIADRFGIESE